MDALQEVLHPLTITAHYREIASAVENNPLVDFYSTGIKDIKGDRFEFVYRSGMKDPAPGNLRGQPARVLQPTGLREDKVYMLHAFNEVSLSMDALQMLREPDNTYLQEKGKTEITRQFEDFGDRHKLFRALALAKTFSDGLVYLNGDGDILESSSGATVTVDFRVPASHKDQLSGIVDTAWDAAGAKILDDLDQIAIQAEVENAPPPKHVWIHPTSKRWLRTNTQILAFLQASPEKANRILAGSTIEDLGGYTWHFYGGTYTAQDGSTKPFLPETKAIITPDVGPWLNARNGSELITQYEGIAADPIAALADVTEVFGDFAYVKLIDNPTKLVLRMGTNFVYVFANPNAVWMPTVDF